MERNKISELEGTLEGSMFKSESNKGSSGIISPLLDAFMPLGYALAKGIMTTMILTDTNNSLEFDLIEARLPYLTNWIIGIYGYASTALEAVRFCVIDKYVIDNIGPDKHYKTVGGFLPWEIIGSSKLINKIIRNK